MKTLHDFRDITEEKLVPITHYCVRNGKGKNVEVPKGQHDFTVVDDYYWYGETKRPNKQAVTIYTAQQLFAEYVDQNLDAIMSGTFISDDDIYPAAKLEFEELKRYCILIGTTVNVRFPIILEKLSKMGGNYQVRKRKWLQYLKSWECYNIFSSELKSKVESYASN